MRQLDALYELSRTFNFDYLIVVRYEQKPESRYPLAVLNMWRADL